MFEIGNNDIMILKEKCKERCWCKQSSFDYEEIEEVIRVIDESGILKA